MTTITISMQPKFYITLSTKLVDLLILISKHHYDAVCREASSPRGYLVQWQRSGALYETDGVFEQSCDFRTLDITMKICERLNMLGLLSGEEIKIVDEFSGICHAAMREGNAMVSSKTVASGG